MSCGGGSPAKGLITPPKYVSAFALCELCNRKLYVAYRDQHKCNHSPIIEYKQKSVWPPPTAFSYFMDDFRHTFEYDNPFINVKNFAKLGGEKWKSFTEDEKEFYREEVAELMEEYNKSLESNDVDDEEKQADEVENKEDAPNGVKQEEVEVEEDDNVVG